MSNEVQAAQTAATADVNGQNSRAKNRQTEFLLRVDSPAPGNPTPQHYSQHYSESPATILAEMEGINV